jgi:protein phosphatase methylesterase 1
MRWKTTWCILLAAFLLPGRPTPGDTSAFPLVDDPSLDQAIESARREFLSKRAYDRLDATVLIPSADGTWHRGSFNGKSLAYPASCVKLAYLAAAMHWCQENNQPYSYLDYCVRPMIEKSDNVQTGVVVDAITGAPNIPDLEVINDKFRAWIEKRRYTERYLESRGLLGNQVILHKTYPTNSGNSPVGAEKLARDQFGMNQMQPRLGASLMLDVVKGGLEPGATGYMRSLLRHDRTSAYAALGFGLPPGSINENKIGVAYDTVEDFMYAILPNGKEFILVAFTNGRDRSQPAPYNVSHLGLFTELLLDRLDLLEGCPPVCEVDDANRDFSSTGGWYPGTIRGYQHGDSYLYSKGSLPRSIAAWDLHVPESGHYEISVWYPQGPSLSDSAPFVIYHTGGSTEVRINQQAGGGRWVKLGDFRLTAGSGRVVLSNDVPDSQYVVADAVKAAKWPDAGGAQEVLSEIPPTGVASKVLARSIELKVDQSNPNHPVGYAIVQVSDNLGAPVKGAEVVGTFIGDFSGEVRGATGSDGAARIETVKFSRNHDGDGIIFSFYIDTVNHSKLAYDPASSTAVYRTFRQ